MAKWKPRFLVEIWGLRPGAGWLPLMNSAARTEAGVWRDIKAQGYTGYIKQGRKFRITPWKEGTKPWRT